MTQPTRKVQTQSLDRGDNIKPPERTDWEIIRSITKDGSDCKRIVCESGLRFTLPNRFEIEVR